MEISNPSPTPKDYTMPAARALVSVKATVLNETRSIQEYISNVSVPKDELLEEC